jgi:hypothetical protein
MFPRREGRGLCAHPTVHPKVAIPFGTVALAQGHLLTGAAFVCVCDPAIARFFGFAAPVSRGGARSLGSLQGNCKGAGAAAHTAGVGHVLSRQHRCLTDALLAAPPPPSSLPTAPPPSCPVFLSSAPMPPKRCTGASPHASTRAWRCGRWHRSRGCTCVHIVHVHT